MVFSSLKWFGGSGRNNSDHFISHREGHKHQARFNKTNDDEALLTIVFAVVAKFNGEWVFEKVLGGIKGNPMFGKILCRLGIVPLKFAIIHDYGLAV